MPNFLDNLGLGFIWDKEETTVNFLGGLVHDGKAIVGYYGHPTIFSPKGDIDFFVKTKIESEDKRIVVTGLDTHCCGRNIWELRNMGINLTPKDSLPTDRVFMFKSHADGSGMLPIHIINADVLPSFLEDDVVRMQMCAFPLEINYYADENDYEEHQPEADDGKRWLLSDGALMAFPFLNNHQIRDEADKEVDCSTDDYVFFRGTVKRLENGLFEIKEGEKITTYIRCVIDTHYGELHFAHTLEQVSEEQRDNLKVGAVVCGVCILSGDAAIKEYDQGIVKDFENDFRLLRQVIVNGEAERMRLVLCEDAVYVSDASNKTYDGIDNIINRLDFVYNEQTEKIFATPATIISVESDELEYPAGTRCLLISYGDEDDYSAIAFLDVNEEGKIKKIYITTDSRYKFKPDEKIYNASPWDDIKIPESVIEPILNRAHFHNLVDDDLSLEEFGESITGLFNWKNNVENMLEALKNNPQPDVEKALENLFGYLFAKAIEMTINENKTEKMATELIASYCPEDAFKGEFFSASDEETHNKLVLTMKIGRQFYKDFKFFTQTKETDDSNFVANITQALIAVQQIGSLYAVKLFGSRN